VLEINIELKDNESMGGESMKHEWKNNYVFMGVILFDISISQKYSVKLDSAGIIQKYFCLFRYYTEIFLYT
jgi:hypothetical protein